MSQLEDLPPDLRAVLSLLLRQRKGYADIATLLGAQEGAVHDRAHAALALLAPRQARALTAAEREEIGEYLLGRGSPTQRLQTYALLEGSDAGREWAQALARELAPLAAEPLPEIPPAFAQPGRTPARPASSRTGGALLLGGLAAVVIVAVVLIVGIGGGGGGSHTATHTTGTSTGAAHASTPTNTTTSTSSASTTAAKPKIGKPLQLTAPEPGTSKAVGIAYVLSQSGKRAFYLIAQNLAPPTGGAFYAVWLESSTAAPIALGSLPTPSSNGHTEGGGALPSNAASFNRIVVTSETNHHPVNPGLTVLSGPFTLD